jgi:hypothetical protein
MTSWDALRLPHVLQNAIHANDLLTITRHLPTPQDALNAALFLALPYSSIQTITHLLAAGAVLSSSAYYAAIKREDIRVLKRWWNMAGISIPRNLAARWCRTCPATRTRLWSDMN